MQVTQVIICCLIFFEVCALSGGGEATLTHSCLFHTEKKNSRSTSSQLIADATRCELVH